MFPRSTPLDVRRTAKRLYGPSIGAGSRCHAACGHCYAASPVVSPGRVIFAASVGEGGLGNLCGIRALLEAWQGQIDTVIAVEGHGLDEVRNAGLAVPVWKSPSKDRGA